MPKQLHITISEPCHERWDEMTPTEQGAFCKACNKNVTDFSTKTQNEIYDIISGGNGKMCGRFTTEQLRYPIVKSEVNSSFFNWRAIAASLAALIASEKTFASGEKLKPERLVTVASADTITAPDRQKDSTWAVTSKTVVEGIVVDAETKEPLVGATILVKGTQTGAIADFDGRFRLEGDFNADAVIQFSYIGYSRLEMPVAKLQAKQTVEMVEMEYMVMGRMTVGIISYTPVNDPFNVYEQDELLERYDPRLDIRKKVRENAKQELK